tara:strand:+ start:1110 stop:3734 length:2625 start_codon:yes stop_codon:yes gene_type:complete
MADLKEYRIQSTGSAANFNITDETRKQPYITTRINGKDAKVYGTKEQLDNYQNKKPDGTKKQPSAQDTAITKAFVEKFKKELGAKTDLDKDKKEDEKKKPPEASNAGSSGTNLNGIVPNPLGQFASVNHLWTMAVLTPKQFNNPNLYRNAVGMSFANQSYDVFSTVDVETNIDGIKATFSDTRTASLQSSIVFSSAGRGDAERVNTKYGKPEYFVDNFNMTSIIAATPRTGNQNAINFTFDILEPYSMGLFLQSLQNAAIKAGYSNYLDSPFLLKLDIIGFDESSKIKKTIKPKFFILKLKKVTFSVDETGSKYAVEAYPYNHQGFSDTVDTAFTDINIGITTGTAPMPQEEKGSVRDLLATGGSSLVALLNKNEEMAVKQGRYDVKDRYEIHFPEKSSQRFSNQNQSSNDANAGATFNPADAGEKSVGGTEVDATTSQNIGNNPIAKSKFGFNVKRGGNFPFKTDKDVVDEETGRVKRGIMQIDESARSFHFTQKQKLTDIITQVILSSTWAKEATQKATKADGMIDWFKIDTQIEFLEYDASIGDFAKKYVYRVVPFKVHSSIFGNPNAIPPGYDILEKNIVKKYEYIYSGQNTEILSFDIDINYLFYTGANPQAETKTKNDANTDNKGPVGSNPKTVVVEKGNSSVAQAANLGKSKVKKNPDLFNVLRGGSGDVDVEQKIAQSFQDAFLNVTSADLVKINFTVMGDTYYLIDSGLSNYFAAESGSSTLLTEDGTMNYEGQDVYIYITFRTPADLNENGSFKFDDGVSPFSGIYRVIKVISKFEGGTFKQELQCIRMQAQPTDFDGKKLQTSTQNNSTVKVTGEAKDKESVSEEILVADPGGTITVGPIPPGEGYADLPGDDGDYGPMNGPQ